MKSTAPMAQRKTQCFCMLLKARQDNRTKGTIAVWRGCEFLVRQAKGRIIFASNYRRASFFAASRARP